MKSKEPANSAGVETLLPVLESHYSVGRGDGHFLLLPC